MDIAVRFSTGEVSYLYVLVRSSPSDRFCWDIAVEMVGSNSPGIDVQEEQADDAALQFNVPTPSFDRTAFCFDVIEESSARKRFRGKCAWAKSIQREAMTCNGCGHAKDLDADETARWIQAIAGQPSTPAHEVICADGHGFARGRRRWWLAAGRRKVHHAAE